MVSDFFNKEMKGHVNDAITFIHKGDIKKTFISLDDLHKYNTINSVQCEFGAKTSISFQYSIIVKLTDYIGTYEKECKKGKGKDGKVVSTIKCNVNAVSRLYTLASYGWKVKKVDNSTFVLTTPYQNKLVSFRRIMDGNENYFDIESILVNRFNGKEFLNYIELDKKDIIKECQKMDRHFIIKWISDRIDKAWN